jgi:hypothetical protein
VDKTTVADLKVGDSFSLVGGDGTVYTAVAIEKETILGAPASIIYFGTEGFSLFLLDSIEVTKEN